jgi:flagellin
MSFSLNTNISAMSANLYANINSNGLSNSINKLSSGSQINSAAANAAGLAIADQMSAKVTGLGQGIQNANESIGMLQIADGAMAGINDNMLRIRELTLQASNGILGDEERAFIQQEIDALLEDSDSIAKSTNYNGINLLDGTGGSQGDGTFVTQSGPDSGDTQSVTIGDAQVASLVGSIDVTTDAGRAAALGDIDSALEDIGGIRADIGASQNQLISSIRNTSLTQINVASAESQIRDVDFAAESMNFNRQNIMMQANAFALAQANVRTSNIAGLLG